MSRQIVIYLLLSILVVVFAQHLHLVIVWISAFYAWVNSLLTPVFSKGGLGDSVCKIILLTAIPVLIAAIPALLYRLIKGKDMPHLFVVTWCLWLIIALSNILIH